ncbi:Ankdd1b [Symbiodinium natans]|uniref:Ankdd1b protein n=1 Tax=Symbiodinium natans TaxID=878477 RepID=A0A812RX53_9DINO|nr:Ankdd1b [Symbiodinium natans]
MANAAPAPTQLPHFLDLEILQELRDEETDKDPQRKRRHLESEKCARDLREFLQAHQFSEDVTEPRIRSSCWSFFRPERTFPLHVAAGLGDPQLVQVLLKNRANPQATDSAGKTALDVALKSDRHGSHRLVIDQLEAPVMSLREAIGVMMPGQFEPLPL